MNLYTLTHALGLRTLSTTDYHINQPTGWRRTHQGHLVDMYGITGGKHSFQMPPSFLHMQTLLILLKKTS